MKLNETLFKTGITGNDLSMRDPNLVITILCPKCNHSSTFNANKISVSTLPKEPSLGCNSCGHIWKGILVTNKKWPQLIDILYSGGCFNYGYKTEIGILKIR